MATIDRHYFRVCTLGARRSGVDLDTLLSAAGIDPAHLEEPGWRGDVAAMARLVRGIWAGLGDEFMGYTARPMPVGALAFALETAIEAPTVADGLARAARFYNLASSDIATRLDEVDGELIVTIAFADPSLDPDHYFREFWLIIWHRLACWLAGETVPLHAAEFDYPRPDAYFEEFKYLFPCPHRFGTSATCIRMEARPLHAPIRRSPAELAGMLARAPLDLMTIPASDHSLQRRVRALMQRDPSIDAIDIAAAVGLSPDALRKRLHREGGGLSTIREHVRRDQATRALATSNRSVESIAAALGYAEPRSFTRAFRAWTGVSPSAYRRGGT